MKGTSNKVGDVYVLPLPMYIKPLPPLIVHNPVSVFMFLRALLWAPNPVQVRHRGSIQPAKDGAAFGVRVADPESALSLWQQGFFGKGSLSRSEPSWFGRTARRLGLDGGPISLEEITEARRAKRREFKRERDLQQRLELIDRRRNEGASAEELAQLAPKTKLSEPAADIETRPEDIALIRGMTIERLEYLHLEPVEAVFLSCCLDVLEIQDADGPGEVLAKLIPTQKAWHEYLVYHYFRSLGWCVRTGVKFGVNFLLYCRGPPFQHAEFGVMVLDSGSEKAWWWLHSNMRVVSGAKKTLMFAYVEGSSELPDLSRVSSVADFRELLQQYTVKPIVFTRFAPSRNRD